MSLQDRVHPAVHLRLRGIPEEAVTRLALRAALTAVHLLGLAGGTHLRQWRGARGPLSDLYARLQQAELQARLAWEVVEILSSRLAKIPDRRRPHYSPSHHFRILELKSLLRWSRELATRVFLVCANTLSNWERSADPAAHTVGVDVKPSPPVRRFADVVRQLVQTMARLGFGGEDLIAATLARAGWKISARSVRRISKERPLAPAPASPPAKIGRPVVARFVHHVRMMDVTVVQSLFGIHPFHLAGVYDAFSRVPLALEVFSEPPRAARWPACSDVPSGPSASRNTSSPIGAAPPRGRPRERPGEAPFTVRYLDPVNRRFPILDSAA
ncbi:MAG TPA: hypothetical protein VGN09_19535 [Vicinamibacteria bacterium]